VSEVGPHAALIAALVGVWLAIAFAATFIGMRRASRGAAATREARLLGEELEHDAARWRIDPEVVPLWRRRRLLLARDALERAGIELHDQARAFLAAGMRAERRRRVTLGAMLVVASATLLGVAGAYVRGIEREQALTQAALLREQDSRGLAEARTRDVQSAQQRIDELLRGIGNSPAKTEVLALQRQIREAPEARTPRAAPRPPTEAATLAPAAASVQRPVPAPAPAPRIRVQNEW